MAQNSFYITTPIYYVNDSPHIGHAYTTIACDVMARYKRLCGDDVLFLTGTDEHGQKVDKAARSANVAPQDFTDEVSLRFRNLVNSGNNTLNVTNDDFVRTTQDRHKQAAQALWQRIIEQSPEAIYKDTYKGWYSVRDEAYFHENELIDGRAPTGAEVEWVEEESYFFRLSAFQDRLIEFYDKNQDFVKPTSRFNEVKSFVKGGKEKTKGALKDLSISRTTFDWGVAVPGDEKHIMYVWIDALTNYLTGTGFPDITTDRYQRYWAQPTTSPVHVVGKDILRFHAVYWPAFLMAANLPLPKKVIAHGWWTIEGEKMSKSLGNVVAPDELIQKYGIDQTRYFLLREVPFGNDGNFAQSRLVEVVNSDLANNIGNLAQRTLSMIQKNCEGCIPKHSPNWPSDEDKLLISAAYIDNSSPASCSRTCCDALDDINFSAALESITTLSNLANEYIDKQAPWILKKKNPMRMHEVLYTLAECIRCIAILLQPFTPNAAYTILNQLAVLPNKRAYQHLSSEYALITKTVLPKPKGVFPRIG